MKNKEIKRTKNQILKDYNVYRASDCTDIEDVRNSIRNLNEVIFIHGDCQLFDRRLFSLRKKEMRFQNEKY
jgi:hypothetical protein